MDGDGMDGVDGDGIDGGDAEGGDGIEEDDGEDGEGMDGDGIGGDALGVGMDGGCGMLLALWLVAQPVAARLKITAIAAHSFCCMALARRMVI